MKCIWHIISYSAMQFAFWASLSNRMERKWENNKAEDNASTAASVKWLLAVWHWLRSSATEVWANTPATSDDIREALSSLLRSWPERYANSLQLVFIQQMLHTFYSCLHSCLPARLHLEPLFSVFIELLVTSYCNYGQTHCKQSLSN